VAKGEKPTIIPLRRKEISQMKIEISIVINRPVEEVFAVMSNHENNPKWNPATLEAKKTSAGPIGVGTIVRSVTRIAGQRLEGESEFIEYEPNRKYATRVNSGPFPMKLQETFESVEGGTRVDARIEVEPEGFFKLAEPLLAKIAKRQLEAALASLKDLMEAHAL